MAALFRFSKYRWYKRRVYKVQQKFLCYWDDTYYWEFDDMKSCFYIYFVPSTKLAGGFCTNLQSYSQREKLTWRRKCGIKNILTQTDRNNPSFQCGFESSGRHITSFADDCFALKFAPSICVQLIPLKLYIK